jgi:uncharacterized protein (TIGR03435 family)
VRPIYDDKRGLPELPPGRNTFATIPLFASGGLRISARPQNGGQDVIALGDPLPDFMTALEDQLGLKPLAKKVPIGVLVVDRAEKVPAEN